MQKQPDTDVKEPKCQFYVMLDLDEEIIDLCTALGDGDLSTGVNILATVGLRSLGRLPPCRE